VWMWVWFGWWAWRRVEGYGAGSMILVLKEIQNDRAYKA
jgi:hypothetical protein